MSAESSLLELCRARGSMSAMIIADMFSVEIYYGDRHLYGEF